LRMQIFAQQKHTNIQLILVIIQVFLVFIHTRLQALELSCSIMQQTMITK